MLRQRAAETRRLAQDSCRDMGEPGWRLRCLGLGLAAAGLAALALEPRAFFAAALVLACGSLLVSQGLKLAGLAATLLRPMVLPQGGAQQAGDLPMISLLVPLLREADIAGTLLKRLEK